MTDANEDRPLTRRELRARERAAELAGAGGPPVPDEDQRREAAQQPEQAGRHSTPSVPAAPADTAALDAEAAARVQRGQPEGDAAPQPAAAPQADAAAQPEAESSAKPLGRFFGRKKDKAEQGPAAPAEQAPPRIEPDATVAMERVDPDATQGLDVIEAQLAEPEAPRAPTAPREPARPDASVPAPWAARRSSAHIDDVQGLDTVDDAAVDDLEIDEVIVEQPRVSSRRIAEVTPAELEDRRKGQPEPDETLVTGPSRGQSQRLPVIVNVVSDTSEHHISDLREQGVAGSGGTSTSSITANALVLPAGSESPDFTLEGDDGLLVTGSIDVPEGFASSGRGRASIDGSDVDSEVAHGEVSSPETAPVRASKAVSSYANARVQIAPKKQRSNVWPIAIGVGAGGFAVAVAGFLALALTQGWL